MKFTNLHHHSTFSYLDGFGLPAVHAARAAELGYSAIALTEHGNVSSHMQLEKAASKIGIKPIFGLEAYCGAADEEGRSQWKNHLTILARDAEGYRNLMRVVTQSWQDFYYHPTVSGETLAAHREGIAVLSGCAGSRLACTLAGGKGTEEHNERPDYDAALEEAARWQDFLGEDYYLEIQPFPELPRTCAINKAYRWISEELGVPLVVTCDVHYPRYEDHEMQAVLHAIGRGNATVDDQMRAWNYQVPLTLPDSDEWLAGRLEATGLPRKWAWYAIEMSAIVAERCNVTLPKAERLRYPITEDDLVPWI